MCFAIPGKVIQVDNEKVIVDYGTEKRQATSLIDVKEGDYVIISGHIVIEKVPEQQALESLKIVNKFKENQGG